ncbi:MAG: N-acetyltransferase [Actinobacteria bacterium]|nr:N-acetyltransferase [Actinomycetota bacterium]
MTAVFDPSQHAHETAIVETGASIGDETRVWHHAHVRGGATVGAHCVIGKNVYIDTQVVIGDRCKIQNNVSVYHGVTIGDDVFVGPAATFTNDLVPRAFNADWKITETTVGDGASIGANATIVCGNRLGAYSMVAAGATVTHDVADHELVAGTPARHLGWVCRCGRVVSRDPQPPSVMQCDECREKVAE